MAKLSIIENTLGVNHQDISFYINNLGEVLIQCKELDDARQLFERALSIDKSIFGEKNIDIGRDSYKLGLIHYKLGDKIQALKYLNDAFEIYCDAFGENHKYTEKVQKSLKELDSIA